MNNYQPRAPHPGRTAVEPCHTTVHATSCNTQSTPGEGMRLGEALELQHRDWHTGRGDTAFEDAVADLDAAHVFVNLAHAPRFAPWRPESVYDLVRRLRRQLAGQVPAGWTPHWFRHSHATALLLSGAPVHVVSRRLGHTDVQTTLNVYAHVT